MPYIKPEQRTKYDGLLLQLYKVWHAEGALPGDLNYIVSRLIYSELLHLMNYRRLNEMVGALECIKLELYRRLAVPYEGAKIEENDDILRPLDMNPEA